MGFNFSAFLGGMGEQISENIESEKAFQREKDFRLEMLGEEEATKARLAKADARRKKAEELEELTATLAGYFGTENAAATVKTLGVGASKDLLKTAQNFDHTTGDFTTAFQFPEIKNGTFGKDLVTAGSNSDDITTTIPITLTDIYTPEKKTEDKTIDTEVKFKLLMSDNLIEINQMPTVTVAQREAKDAAKAEWDGQMKSYTDVINQIEDAKREGKPEKKDREYYTDAQINDMLEKSIDVEFSIATGFAGAREEYRQTITGSNTIPYSRVMGLISEQTANLDFRNDINLTKEATARYYVAKDDLTSFAKGKTSALITSINENGFEKAITNADIAKPTGIMEMEDFIKASSEGTLARQGIYLVKRPDNRLSVITYLDKNNPFDSKKRNYIIHRTVKGFSDTIFNSIQTKFFGD